MVAARGRREREGGRRFQNGGRKKKGPRRDLKGPDLGVESGHAEVWRLSVK